MTLKSPKYSEMGDAMAHNLFKSILLFSLITLTVLLSGQTIRAATAGLPGLTKSENEVSGETVEVPENLDSDQIDSFLATLSDAQVRRLLIQELKEEAAREIVGTLCMSPRNIISLLPFCTASRQRTQAARWGCGHSASRSRNTLTSADVAHVSIV